MQNEKIEYHTQRGYSNIDTNAIDIYLVNEVY